MGNYDWLSGLYLESEDGLNWSEYMRGHEKGAHYFPIMPKGRYERVQVLFRDGLLNICLIVFNILKPKHQELY